MSEKVRVLMVDDEPNVLSGYRRSIGRQYDLVTANSGKEALEILRNQDPFAVVITDMRMPEMDGLVFLKQARKICPKSVYVMLTGNSDQQTAIDAINHGEIYRFLNKPCETALLERTIKVCKSQYDLIHAEATLLNDTLAGSIRLLVEALVISDPEIASIVKSVRECSRRMLKCLGIKDWRVHLAGSLFLIGGCVVPRANKEEIYTDEFMRVCATAGAGLLRHIPRLGEVSAIVSGQREVAALPSEFDAVTDESCVLVGSQVLRFAFDWSVRTHHCAGDEQAGLRELVSADQSHDPRLVQAAMKAAQEQAQAQADESAEVPIDVPVREIKEGMRTEQAITTSGGMLLIGENQVITQVMAERLKGFAKAGMIRGTVSMYAKVPEKRMCA